RDAARDVTNLTAGGREREPAPVFLPNCVREVGEIEKPGRVEVRPDLPGKPNEIVAALRRELGGKACWQHILRHVVDGDENPILRPPILGDAVEPDVEELSEVLPDENSDQRKTG